MAIKEMAHAVGDSNGTNGLDTEGSLTSFKNLYQGPADNNKKWTWLDKEPEDVPDAAENEQTAQHAIITRLQKANDSRKKFELHSIIIQSPQLKDSLAEILQDYPGIHCGLRRLEFEAPFSPFVHRWSQLIEYKARKDLDETTAQHIELLYNVLRVELNDVITTLDDYVDHGIVDFDHVWTIFQPGSIIYSGSHHGTYGAYRLQSAKYMKTQCGRVYSLSLEAVDFNGTVFGRSTTQFSIREFIGTVPITGLSAFPLSLHPKQDEVKELLVARGKKFEAVAGRHHKEYNGFAVSWNKEDKEIPFTCSGRIIIDSNSFGLFSNRYFGNSAPIPAKEGAPEPGCVVKEVDTDDLNDTAYVFGKQAKTEQIRLTEQHHLICLSRVRGYSLRKKEWLLFYLDQIKDIDFNTNAFDSLVLPPDQKELILSFAESQAMQSTPFDDVISGKGRGHITLLSGPPGVGKTLTAESVAEHMRAPLFMMSSADLGLNPDKIESNLTDILEMVATWNAVLLLDECDVFLEARSTHDLERNKLVSIFLRVLEYYEGLLFLTTNRVDNIDAAFQSRIHISIAYPALTVESRRHIWENFIVGLDLQQDWRKEDLDELAMVMLNGRQIKNVLKSAALLAARKKEVLSRKYVDMVLTIEGKRPGVAEKF
ncbi:P-loop containing nucleoside triphosphate hydrolase protein [Dothidotthia symphoricarpi CBS 119687]|uniref:P-loop containing nucleoside triphosphate hydrolase protein n=1 Tax=Dothidotthia symphoricarpi CBS 119687 TaxID=1392245 RepID=A0A6A6ADS3_9PLEO|nr:P-loop containing nucleoside triphosphate hydrolase protein [Dothidotthia symphoricarpi CBS 119687]KAF2130042.1 P-loop containing nucleoside triphosphate hydrolase protein [Dothidotthia symphoricarpi CBS 119687]